MKRVLSLGIILFLTVLAVVIGKRMSTDAMAVVIGVIFGVAASIPTSLLIMATTRRSSEARPPAGRPPYDGYSPPVIVISPNAQQPGYSSPTSLMPPMPPAGRRRFHVVGEDGWSGDWDDDTVEADDWRRI
ncbi:MAG: hypothetical protein J7M34_10985 [Anaerolineae bacterium]|nr:hypothetical protein [Anaerolineae bacterium]